MVKKRRQGDLGVNRALDTVAHLCYNGSVGYEKETHENIQRQLQLDRLCSRPRR